MSNCIFIANHVRFMELNRGILRKKDGWAILESSKPECCCAYELNGATEDIPSSNILYIYGDEKKSVALQKGYVPSDRITHMSRSARPAPTSFPEGFNIKTAQSLDDIRIFTEVQCRSFLESTGAYESWAPFLSKMNEQAFGRSEQQFHIGFLDGQAVTVALTLIEGSTVGVYAVATLPEFRRRGLSSVLLNNLLGSTDNLPCLQVKTGSAAHEVYRKLGFKDEFDVEIYKK